MPRTFIEILTITIRTPLLKTAMLQTAHISEPVLLVWLIMLSVYVCRISSAKIVERKHRVSSHPSTRIGYILTDE